MITKVCTKCGVEKALDEFYRSKKGLHGRRSDCKKCKDAYNLARIHRRPDLQEKNRQRAKKWYWENQEKAKERIYQWTQDNHERVLANKRRYWHEAIDKKEYNKKRQKRRRERYKTDPEFRKKRKLDGRHSAKVRKARLRGAEGTYTQQDWQEILDRYGNKCLCCGSVDDLTVDHVIPVSKGGSNFPSNLQPLCLHCNASKNDKAIDYRPYYSLSGSQERGYSWLPDGRGGRTS